jgi:2-hydroxycyclohexanecarboxyl-CoA dehydrogenase
MTSNKVALVTGAAAGIGAACSKRLAQDGIAIGVLDLDEARCAETVAAIQADGGQAVALGADVSDRAQVQAAVAKLRDAFGPVTITVNNAGVTDFTPFDQVTEAQWEFVYKINVLGSFLVAQEALPDMKTAGWGRIVNISSSSAQSGAALMAHYSASKGGMIALTKTLAQEFGPHGITCNTIPPRFVHNTTMSNASFELPEMKERFEPMVQAGPIRRHGEPEDIAGAAAYLVSDEAGYVTGQVLGVNGGRYI